MFRTSLLVSLIVYIEIVAAKEETIVFEPEDISHVTLYGPTAVYRPASCPNSIAFTDRARRLSALADDKIGIRPSDMIVNGKQCRADAQMFDFAPIGKSRKLPAQCKLLLSLIVLFLLVCQ